MILLDTDHVNVLKYPDHPRFANLTTRLNTSADQDVATTVITVEEQMRGWLAWINRSDDVRRQVLASQELLRLLTFLRAGMWCRLMNRRPANSRACARSAFTIGTMDLKIAAIALGHGALLLSANLRDFQQIPNLHVANWIN